MELESRNNSFTGVQWFGTTNYFFLKKFNVTGYGVEKLNDLRGDGFDSSYPLRGLKEFGKVIGNNVSALSCLRFLQLHNLSNSFVNYTEKFRHSFLANLHVASGEKRIWKKSNPKAVLRQCLIFDGCFFSVLLLDALSKFTMNKWRFSSNQISCTNLNTQVEIQTQIFVWSDFPDRKYLWSDFPDKNSPWSDFPDPSYLWSDFSHTKGLWSDFSDWRCSYQTIFRPFSRLKFRPLPRP